MKTSEAIHPTDMVRLHRSPIWRLGWFLAVNALFAGLFGPLDQSRATEGGRMIIGSVSSADTRNMLQGATVRAPALNRQAVTDNTGRFVLPDIPPGPVELVVSYVGFGDQRQTVAAGGGSVSFEMRAANLIVLDKITVAGEREGNALALTQQRNAANLKNVIAMDAFGPVTFMNVGDITARMPGVAYEIDSEGITTAVAIRGMSSGLTRMTVDGMPMSPVGDRSPHMASFSGAIFEQIELTKGQLPDKSAESLGGMINLKTRSALAMREKRRFDLNVAGRWAPPFYGATKVRREHPLHPSVKFGYQEVFSVNGGDRNLGIMANIYYAENVNSRDLMVYDYQNTTNSPAYVYNFSSSTQYNNYHLITGNIRVDYRLSDATQFYATATWNQTDEPTYKRAQMTLAAGQTVAALGPDGQPTGTGVILPNFTDAFTATRPITGSTLTLATNHFTYHVKNPTVVFGGEHQYSHWKIDYAASHSMMETWSASGQTKPGRRGSQLSMQVPAAGWALRYNDHHNPMLVSGGGPSIFDIANYRSVQMNVRSTDTDKTASAAEANFAFRPDTPMPLTLKTGLSYRRNTREVNADPARYNFAGVNSQLLTGFDAPQEFDRRNGVKFPWLDASATYQQMESNPALWAEDHYFRVQQNLTLKNDVTEEVSSAYLMGQGRLVGRLGVIAGVRFERTDTSATGNVRRQRLATATEIRDPAARATYDYANRVSTEGGYDRWFPSLHFSYDVLENLKAMASWSTSYGRPNFAQLVPGITINDTAQTVTMNNPAIGPQYSKNVDLSLQYYMKSSGIFSVGYFSKDIADYIISSSERRIGSGNENGFNGEYADYELFTTRNIGSAKVNGYEAEYRQALTFLPGPFKGLDVTGSATWLKTKGDYGGTTTREGSQIAGFIPRVYNVSVGYTHRAFTARLLFSYRSDYLNAYSAVVPRNNYTLARNVWGAQTTYRWRPNVSFYLNLDNFTNEPQDYYRYSPRQISQAVLYGPTLSFGMNGRF